MTHGPRVLHVPDEVIRAEEDVEVVREIIAYMREHAEELRAKGLPIDDMIQDLEEKIGEVLAAAKKVRDLRVEDEILTEKREHLRRDIDGIAARLPPDLVDGFATIEYLKGATEREFARRRRGKKGLGG